MGKKLVIAEKPMLAKAILDAIPGTAKSIKAGERVFYTEKGDYLVVALAGHVLQLKEPEDYDPKYKKWTLEDLPIFFPDWAAVPAQGKGNIVKCVKSLLPQADSVIHAGDVDDEGQLIVDELLRYCGYRGKVQRLYTSDTSTAALKKRLGMLEDNAKWEPLGVSAYARSVTDKTFGMARKERVGPSAPARRARQSLRGLLSADSCARKASMSSRPSWDDNFTEHCRMQSRNRM